jgi:hypothetical protein
MNTNVVRKNLVIAVILLFIGVAVAPSINVNVVKASDDNELVEVTTEACGINGFGNTTVKLTRQQYQNLEQYLVEFRVRLNQTTTREEAVPLFKEAVVELNKYGLLPKGMDIEQAQKLTTQYDKSMDAVNGLSSSLGRSGYSNLCCMIAGRATYCCVAGPIITGFKFVISNLFWHAYSAALGTLWVYLAFLLILRNDLSFFNLLSLLAFGGINLFGWVFPAVGWIYTAGLQGIKNYTGAFFGKIHYPVKDFFGTLYTGAVGFTGFKIIFPDHSSQFLGTALWVNISDSLS